MSIDYQQILLQLAHERLPHPRTHTYSYEYFIKMFIHILNDVTSYIALKRLFNLTSNHYKYINQVFNKWTKLNIFEDAYYKYLNYYLNINYNSQSTIEMYIGATNIYNKNGSECVAYGSYKKKKISKLSVISDKKVPLQINLYNGNMHDIKTIEPEIINMINSISYRKINIAGDKGYVSKILKQKLKLVNINLITPCKKNQLHKNTKHDKQILKNRFYVEHMNHLFKNYMRIALRKDRNRDTFMSYVYLAAIIIISKYV